MKKIISFLFFILSTFLLFSEQKSFLMGTEYIMNGKKGSIEYENSYFIGYQYDNFLWIEYLLFTDKNLLPKEKCHYNMIDSKDKGFMFYFEQNGKKYVANLSFYTNRVVALEVDSKEEGLEILCAWTYNYYYFCFEKHMMDLYPKGYWSDAAFMLKFPESFRKKYGFSKDINNNFYVEVWNNPKAIVKEIKNSQGYYRCNKPYPRYKNIELKENHSADCMADLDSKRISYIAPVECIFLDEKDPNILKLINAD